MDSTLQLVDYSEDTVLEEDIFVSYGSLDVKVFRAMGGLGPEHFIPTKKLDKRVVVNIPECPHMNPIQQVESSWQAEGSSGYSLVAT